MDRHKSLRHNNDLSVVTQPRNMNNRERGYQTLELSENAIARQLTRTLSPTITGKSIVRRTN